jgi:uncharacterized membrane protein (UPF0127 family)
MITHRVEHNRRRLAMNVHVCQTRRERGRGLLLRRCPDARTAYLLPRCSSIHTIGMTYPIDVFFCDERGTILRVIPKLRPWRIASHPGAACVWEMRSGSAHQWGWQVGDRIGPS